jgi:hypothetical protein
MHLWSREDLVRDLAELILPRFYNAGEVEDGHLLRAIEKALVQHLRLPETELFKRNSFTLRLTQDIRNYYQQRMMPEDPNLPIYHPRGFHKDPALYFDKRDWASRKQLGEVTVHGFQDNQAVRFHEQGIPGFRSARALQRITRAKSEMIHAELERVEEIREVYQQTA